MQKDFHYAVTYIICRWADLPHEEALKIAYSCQLVDDNCDYGVIRFGNGALSSNIPSSHDPSDYKIFSTFEQYKVTMPFHFLPGNNGEESSAVVKGGFVNKLLVIPNSYVAKDMVSICLNTCSDSSMRDPYRMGITLHVLSDTWAHQGFVGVRHRVNDIKLLDNLPLPEGSKKSSVLKDYIIDKINTFLSLLLSNTFPIGHSAALIYPDLPYLEWEYEDNGIKCTRKNYDVFTDATEAMYEVLVRHTSPLRDLTTIVLSQGRKDLLKQLLMSFTDRSAYDRAARWTKMISEGAFGFEPVELPVYDSSGLHSWRYKALGNSGNPEYFNSYLTSDWKLFQDALFAHKYIVTRVILPKYGICAA